MVRMLCDAHWFPVDFNKPTRQILANRVLFCLLYLFARLELAIHEIHAKYSVYNANRDHLSWIVQIKIAWRIYCDEFIVKNNHRWYAAAAMKVHFRMKSDWCLIGNCLVNWEESYFDYHKRMCKSINNKCREVCLFRQRITLIDIVDCIRPHSAPYLWSQNIKQKYWKKNTQTMAIVFEQRVAYESLNVAQHNDQFNSISSHPLDF